MTAPVMDRVDAVRVSLAAEGIVVSCELDDGTVCVHVDSPRPAVGPVESTTEAHVLHELARVAYPLRWTP
ncbi:hypothetical protein [Catenuloplanes japonicus]|uniref:hypothetical protein n=1 Tax=Catenuloplanes japonicus TaxID=33876 RepID=UPI000AB9B6B2|nr:hypothetical protein [Catenuloplanes japonicus]